METNKEKEIEIKGCNACNQHLHEASLQELMCRTCHSEAYEKSLNLLGCLESSGDRQGANCIALRYQRKEAFALLIGRKVTKSQARRELQAILGC